MNTAILFQTQSTIILLLLLYGIKVRKNRNLHPKIMLTAIIWDLLLVLQIELSRNAVKKAMDVPEQSTLLTIHIIIAVSTVVLYGLLIFLGRKLLKGKQAVRPLHMKLGWLAIVFRLSTYITSFLIVPGGQ